MIQSGIDTETSTVVKISDRKYLEACKLFQVLFICDYVWEWQKTQIYAIKNLKISKLIIESETIGQVKKGLSKKLQYLRLRQHQISCCSFALSIT